MRNSLMYRIISILVILTFFVLLANPYSVLADSSDSYVYFFSVGHSDAMLVQCGNKFGLIDAGDPMTGYTSRYLTNYTDSFSVSMKQQNSWPSKYHEKDTDIVNTLKSIMGSSTLDFVIATHSHSDHIGGIADVANSGLVNSLTKYYYKPYVPSYTDTTYNAHCYNNFYYTVSLREMQKNHAQLIDVTSNKGSDGTIKFSLGSSSFVLYNLDKGSYSDENENSNSIVTYAKINNSSFVFSGDIDNPSKQDEIAKKIGKIDVLKPAHHGKADNTSITTLNYYKPKYVVLTTLSDRFAASEDAEEQFKGQLLYSKTNGNFIQHLLVTDFQKGDFVKFYVTSSNVSAVGASCSKYKSGIPSFNSKNGWHQCGNRDFLRTEDNQVILGWKEIYYNNEKCWFYMDSSGLMVRDWQLIKDKFYYFNQDGVMLKGIQTINYKGKDRVYFFGDDGAMKTGWHNVTINGVTKSYYFSESSGDDYGAMIENAVKPNENNDPSTNTLNSAINIKTLSKIEIVQSPSKTNYIVGNKLDLTGLKVEAVYSDKSREDITSKCTTSMANNTVLSNAGNYQITVTYEYKETKVSTYSSYSTYATKRKNVNFSIVVKEQTTSTTLKVSTKNNPSSVTSEYVIVTITSNLPLKNISGWTPTTSSNTVFTKKFYQNAIESFYVYTQDGTQQQLVSVNVSNIDKTIAEDKLPSLSVNVYYSITTPTKKAVTVTLDSNLPIESVSGWTMESDKKLSRMFAANVTNYSVTIKSTDGQSVKKYINISNIVPSLTVSSTVTPAGPTKTKGPVTITLKANLPLKNISGWTLSSDGMTLTKTFSENLPAQVLTIWTSDETQHWNQFLSISHIDNSTEDSSSSSDTSSSDLKLTVNYSPTGRTNTDVVVTITANKKINSPSNDWKLSSNGMSITRTYTSNGAQRVKVYATDGTSAGAYVSVMTIDKEAPTLNVSYSYSSSKTNCTVTIKSNESIKQVSGWTLSNDEKSLTKTFTSNTNTSVKVYDLANNSSSINVNVSKISSSQQGSTNTSTTTTNSSTSTKLKATVSYTKLTNKQVKVTVTANKELKEHADWNLSSDKKTLTKIYTYNTKYLLVVYAKDGTWTNASVNVTGL